MTSQSRVRNLRDRLRGQPDPEPATLLVPDGTGRDVVDVLIVIEAPTASQLASLMTPMRFLAPERIAVLTTASSRRQIPVGPISTSVTVADHQDLNRALPRLRCVLTYGHHMRLGAIADTAARMLGATSFVIQHGIITPLAPPLPEDAQLLAWSSDDAAYWSCGRPDVTTHVVGSQLLHQAARSRPAEFGASNHTHGITYLGQLHGHELPRHSKAAAAVRFCRSTGATYRPHPSEQDRLSRMQHALWRRRGVRFDVSGLPLHELRTEMVSVFSTGVLEAAAAGIPSWVDFPDPPEWLEELWQRYSMARFGSAEPTAVEIPTGEPARVIAELIDAHTASSR